MSRRELACHRPLKSSARCFFLTDPWEEENGKARVADSLSEKKAYRERREARLKHSQCEHSAPLGVASFSPSVTHTQCECHQRAGDSVSEEGSLSLMRRNLRCGGRAADYIARRPSYLGRLWRAA